MSVPNPATAVVAPAVTPADLVAAYDAGSDALLSTPTRTVLARGNQLSRPTMGLDQVATAVRSAALADPAQVPLAVLPFDPAGAATVIAGAETLVATGARAVGGPALLEPVGAEWRARRHPSRDAYAAAVRTALDLIGDGALAKVVLARTLELRSQGPTDGAALVRRLAGADAATYTFGVPDGAGQLVGASPELLVSRTGRHVVSRPLAGSAPRSAEPGADREQGLALLHSAKDVAEHGFVVDAAREALAPYCDHLVVSPEPALVATSAVWHLQTEITGELRDPAVTSLDLALALHPTPAVCGTPTALALDTIRDLEPFDRGAYAGVVGWTDASGDGEWAIALRCAEVRPDVLRLYAGAGIVAGSDPAAEVVETSAKFQTILEAMGLESMRVDGDA